MNLPTNYAAAIKSRAAAKKPGRIHSPAHELAERIANYFSEPKKFARYLGIVNRLGVQRASELWGEVKDSTAKNPAALFFYKAKK